MRSIFWQTGGFLLACVMFVTGYAPAVHAADLQINSGLFPGPFYPSRGFTGDGDGDGVANNMDAFPGDPTESIDFDGDGVGDNADAFPFDPLWDTDTDGDGVDDLVDNCPMAYNPMQIDENGNLQGDLCDLMAFSPLDFE